MGGGGRRKEEHVNLVKYTVQIYSDPSNFEFSLSRATARAIAHGADDYEVKVPCVTPDSDEVRQERGGAGPGRRRGCACVRVATAPFFRPLNRQVRAHGRRRPHVVRLLWSAWWERKRDGPALSDWRTVEVRASPVSVTLAGRVQVHCAVLRRSAGGLLLWYRLV